MTDAEKALWRALRCRQVSGLKFRRQHPFGDYILDFVCLENKLVIEVDGGQHRARTKDEIRTQNLLMAGFRVLRFWDNEVLQEIEAVKERIWGAVQGEQTHPRPNPPLEGEEPDAAHLEGEEPDAAHLEGEEPDAAHFQGKGADTGKRVTVAKQQAHPFTAER